MMPTTVTINGNTYDGEPEVYAEVFIEKVG
jgi:hypothetical protein